MIIKVWPSMVTNILYFSYMNTLWSKMQKDTKNWLFGVAMVTEVKVGNIAHFPHWSHIIRFLPLIFIIKDFKKPLTYCQFLFHRETNTFTMLQWKPLKINKDLLKVISKVKWTAIKFLHSDQCSYNIHFINKNDTRCYCNKANL